MTTQRTKVLTGFVLLLIFFPFCEALYTRTINLDTATSSYHTGTFPTSQNTGYFPLPISYFYCYGLSGSCSVKALNYVGINNTALHVNMTFHLNSTYYVNESDNVQVSFNTASAGDNFKIGFRQDGVFKGYSANTYSPISDTFNGSADMGGITFNGTFNEIEVYASKFGGGNADFLLQQVNFTYRYSLSENSLPSFNVTVFSNKVICMNDSDIYWIVPIEISAYDPENNTIYYSNGQESNLRQESITFTKRDCFLGICTNSPDYTFLDENPKIVYPYSDSCRINKDNWNITAIETSFNVLPTNDWYALDLGYNCTGNRELFFDLDSSSKYVYLQLLNSGFFGSNGSMVLSLKNFLFEDIIKLNFTEKDGRMIVYELNVTPGSKLVYNYSKADFTVFQIVLDNMFNVTTTPKNYTLYIDDEPRADIGFYDPGLEDKDVKYFTFETPDDGSHFRIRSIKVNWQEALPVFSLVKPNNLTIYNYPHNLFDFYVTDSIHINRENTHKQIDVKVMQNCLSQDVRIGNSDLQVATDNIDILGIIKSLLGKELQDYLNGIGEYESGRTILYTMWFVFFVGLIIFEYGLTTKIDFTFPLAVSSVACFFIAFLVDYVESMIVFLFLIALALAGPLAGLYKRGHHER